MKVGVFLARMQPMHNGHLEVLKIAEKNNEKVIVLLGSADKSGEKRNPLHINLRIDLLKETLEQEFGDDWGKRFEVYPLDDWSHENDFDARNEWGHYLYYNIVSRAGIKNDFKLYFSDNPAIMLSWFDNVLRDRINFTFLEREYIEDGISATKVRKEILDGNLEFVSKSVPKSIFSHVSKIKSDLIASLD